MNPTSQKLINTKDEVRFTILGHASLYIEFGDIRLITDPWLIGSCYWRSWWNYPEVDNQLLNKLNPTHIYLTHLHWDHYHGPSLRFFEKFNPKILLPKACTVRMLNDMNKFFNFINIEELVHGKEFSLGPGFKITSYQFNPIFIDSALSINVGGVNLLNVNDSKTYGLSLNQITSNYKYFDFVFRSHSSATQLPYCIKNYEELGFKRPPSEYTDEFLSFSSKVNARYAVPFASSHVYLHKDSEKFNYLYNSPLRVLKESNAKNYTDSIVKLMPSGSSWSSLNGFKIVNHDYENIQKHISELKHKHNDSLQSQYSLELKSKPNYKAFNTYFYRFFKALRFLPCNIRFGFVFSNNETNFRHDIAIVDMKKNKLIIENEKPKNFENIKDLTSKYKLDFIIETTTKIFNDCNTKEMFNCWGPSKLLTIYLNKRKSYKKYVLFCLIIDLYENDGLPIWKFFSNRQIQVRVRRWREVFDICIYFFKIKIQKKPTVYLWK